MEKVKKGKPEKFKLDDSDVLWYQDCLCVPNDENLRKFILGEAYHFPYIVHLGSTKMYQDLK